LHRPFPWDQLIMWGIYGYCWIPYDYLASPDLAGDS